MTKKLNLCDILITTTKKEEKYGMILKSRYELKEAIMEKDTKTIFWKGKLIDMDTASLEELKKIQKDLQKKEAEIRRKIEQELEMD